MRILALEFSSSRRSAALVEDGHVLCRAGDDLQRAKGPVSLMNDVLGQAGLDTQAVEGVAVGLGPGSYTGIRVAIALAQGLELGLGARLLGVSSVESLVWRAWLEGTHGDVAMLVDAQRGELYAARYHLTDLGVEPRQSLALLSRAEVQRWVEEGAALFGPDLDEVELPVRPLYPEAGMVGVLAAGSADFVPGQELTPIYLRQPQFVKAPTTRAIPPLNRSPASSVTHQPGNAAVARPAPDNP